MDVVIYHNPRCSKSRQTLDLLKSRGFEPEVVEYLKSPPSREKIVEILGLLNLPPRALIRTGEAVYTQQGLDDPAISDDRLLDALVEHPIMMQRPVVVANGKAAIGRPPENVLTIL